MNPFKRLPLYGKELLTEYFNMGYMRQQGIEPPQALGPHVFAIADSAYRDMMKVGPLLLLVVVVAAVVAEAVVSLFIRLMTRNRYIQDATL